MTDESDNKSNQRLDSVLRIIGVIILVIFIAVLPVLAFTNWILVDVRSLLLQHSGPFVALPGAGVFALLVVAIFQITFGKIEFEVVGPPTIKLTGGAGPILMWIIAYSVIAISMYFLWHQTDCPR